MADNARVARDFLGSAHVFATAVRDVMEERLLHEVVGPQVSVSQLKVLTLLASTDTHTIGNVAAFLGVSKAAASQTVDRLARRKWLRRIVREADRRTTDLFLTESGRRLLAAYESARAKRLAKVFRGFAPTELIQVADLLDRVSAQIVNHTAKPEEICLQCGIYFRERCLLRNLTGRTCFYQRHRVRNETRGVVT
ncbi:MAG: MarR family transcriptional regulator [Acidobacteriia bacterium]|nr:MarR family transcriptional regulator [Terriglobia bacterium]